jgi:hypothetical protein
LKRKASRRVIRCFAGFQWRAGSGAGNHVFAFIHYYSVGALIGGLSLTANFADFTVFFLFFIRVICVIRGSFPGMTGDCGLQKLSGLVSHSASFPGDQKLLSSLINS